MKRTPLVGSLIQGLTHRINLAVSSLLSSYTEGVTVVRTRLILQGLPRSKNKYHRASLSTQEKEDSTLNDNALTRLQVAARWEFPLIP
jgi:hypothetical protein